MLIFDTDVKRRIAMEVDGVEREMLFESMTRCQFYDYYEQGGEIK